MNDRETVIQDLKDAVIRFADERDWGQYHAPKNLVMGLSIEVGELMEHFLWKTGEASKRPEDLDGVADELADVFIYVLNLLPPAGIGSREGHGAEARGKTRGNIPLIRPGGRRRSTPSMKIVTGDIFRRAKNITCHYFHTRPDRRGGFGSWGGNHRSDSS